MGTAADRSEEGSNAAYSNAAEIAWSMRRSATRPRPWSGSKEAMARRFNRCFAASRLRLAARHHDSETW